MLSHFPNPKPHYIPLNYQKPLPQPCLFEAAVVNLSSVLVTLYKQEQGQHKLYIKQKQLKPIVITGIPPTWMVTSCTWKSPWWWTTPSWLWSRERREYSVCSSILPCRSSWVSIPLSPLSSKVRIFRKREMTFIVPRKTQMPPTSVILGIHMCLIADVIALMFAYLPQTSLN